MVSKLGYVKDFKKEYQQPTSQVLGMCRDPTCVLAVILWSQETEIDAARHKRMHEGDFDNSPTLKDLTIIERGSNPESMEKHCKLKAGANIPTDSQSRVLV